MGEMSVGLLLVPFGDKSRHSGRRCAQLFAQSYVFCKRRPLQNRRNGIGRGERLLINLQFVEGSDDHGGRDGKSRSRLSD